tara:strand:+ start:6025 stop:7569 length:1545 start_codon:yes stop_codon:yes gene_type:complete
MQESKKYQETGNKILLEALRMHKDGKIIDAKRLYLEYLDMGLLHPIALSNYGIICKQEGDIEQAFLFFKMSINKYPNHVDAYINLGNLLIDAEKYEAAKKYSYKAIKLANNNAFAQNNHGIIMQNLNQYEEAVIHFKKAINPKENWETPYYNIANLYKEIGKVKDAEINARSCLEINCNNAKCNYLLSVINPIYLYERFGKNLFSEQIKSNVKKTSLIYINFAKANVMHAKKNFKESAKYLKIANNLKLKLHKSDCNPILKKTETLIKIEKESKPDTTRKDNQNSNIFIVGMPRSGSTLVESIISMNKEVTDLGEINIFEEVYLDWVNKEKLQTKKLDELYQERINSLNIKTKITTNKWLYNYQYAGLIAKYLCNAKIIHCIRNPLDNILSIYRANFDKGNSYSSSIYDCAKVYFNHLEAMNYYKKKYSSKIYTLDYDQLVSNPEKQIKKITSWLSFEWDDLYLKPHLNERIITTASNIQVRKPINSNSVNGSSNYMEMLEPAIKYFQKQNNIL